MTSERIERLRAILQHVADSEGSYDEFLEDFSPEELLSLLPPPQSDGQ